MKPGTPYLQWITHTFYNAFSQIGAEYERIRPLAKSVEEVDSNVLNLVDRYVPVFPRLYF